MRRIRSEGCARAASGHVVAAPPRRVIKSRRRMWPLKTGFVQLEKPSTSRPGREGEMEHNRPQTQNMPNVSDGRVEDGRGSLGHSATLRFPSPLIEPDVPISGIRLSDRFTVRHTESKLTARGFGTVRNSPS